MADVERTLPRVPASNQKLISTAFALDRLGTDFRLRTRLLRHSDGSLEIVGEEIGSSIAEIQRFAMVALGEEGSRSANSTATPIRLLVREEPKRRWWPGDWQQADRPMPMEHRSRDWRSPAMPLPMR